MLKNFLINISFAHPFCQNSYSDLGMSPSLSTPPSITSSSCFFFLSKTSSSCSSLAARRKASVHAKRTYRIERVDTLRASSMWMACARFSRRFTDLFLMLRMQCEIKSAAKHRCKIELFLNEIYFVTIVEAMV